MSRILILGAGTAGTIMANRLRRLFAADVRAGRSTITVVDPDDQHLYQPGLLFVPFGRYTPDELLRPRRAVLHPAVVFLRDSVDRVVAAENLVYLRDGTRLPYDVLIVASGTRVVPQETAGLDGPGWQRSIFDFYTLDGATKLQRKLADWPGGRLVIDIADMPIKCPVAPLEFAFLADEFFTRRGIRDRVEIAYVTPLDAAFTKATCARALAYLLDEKRVELVTEFATARVDGESGTLWSWDDRRVPFDLLVAIPVHAGAEFVSRSPGLGDDMGFVLTDPHTLQARVAPNVFAIGDATNVPASKAGSVAHFEAEVLAPNVARFVRGQPLAADFDGHANCFIETGHRKALLIDFNYDVEPLPGTFPLPGIGPLRLLAESWLNHLGKLAFRWVYWNVLLPGLDIPLVGTRMTMRGKHALPPTSARSEPRTPVGV